MALPRNPPPPVTSAFIDSFPAAQTASFSRKILALWRMSTGKAGWNRMVSIAWVWMWPRPWPAIRSCDRSCSRLSTPFFQLDAEDRALARRARRRRPARVRKTCGMGVEHRLAGIVKSVPVRGLRPGATCGRRTRPGPPRRGSRGRPCGARSRPLPDRRSWRGGRPPAGCSSALVTCGPLHDDLADLPVGSAGCRPMRIGSSLIRMMSRRHPATGRPDADAAAWSVTGGSRPGSRRCRWSRPEAPRWRRKG